jgi:hypothetical protein
MLKRLSALQQVPGLAADKVLSWNVQCLSQLMCWDLVCGLIGDELLQQVVMVHLGTTQPPAAAAAAAAAAAEGQGWQQHGSASMATPAAAVAANGMHA